jgi:hypothetical protein
MATCDCCGKYYTFGGLKAGRYAFCNGTCRSRGSVLVALDEVPPRSVADYIDAAHRSDCPSCGRPGPVDLRRSHWAWSALIVTRWGTDQRIECVPCGRLRQVKAMGFSLLVGWWGVPFGLVLTPVQLVRNAIALVQSNKRPSADFERLMRLELARRTAQDAGAAAGS